MNVTTEASRCSRARAPSPTSLRRIALALEGRLRPGRACRFREVVRVLAEPSLRAGEFPAAGPGGMEMARTFRSAHARYWPSLVSRVYG
jgi:hypothetical protein